MASPARPLDAVPSLECSGEAGSEWDTEPPFQSFWMGGFEGADHVNGWGVPLDPHRSNGHAEHLLDDYVALRSVGLGVARESIGWRLLDARGVPGLRALEHQARLAASQNLQVIWSLMHYGWPGRLDPFARPQQFVEAFGAHCRTVAEVLNGVAGPQAVYQPINEISFLAWAATTTGLIWPHTPGDPARGLQLKRVLVQAALRGTDAIRRVAPRARIVHTDPLIHVEPPLGAGPQACVAARQEHENQFQAWDMLSGRLEPELGGAPHYLDILGLNYYHNNQWEHASNARLHWHLGSPRRKRFSDLADSAWRRYQRPLCIAETGHVGVGRADWIDHMAREIVTCQANGIPLAGICLYPVIDRADWQDAAHWHHCGLWDVPGAALGDFTRVLCEPYAQRLAHWQQSMAAPTHPNSLSPERTTVMNTIVVFSHLRWDFVYQRPQQLMSRLALKHPVLFIEEPLLDAELPWAEIYAPCSGVEVLRIHLPGTSQGFADENMAAMRALLIKHLIAKGIHDYLLWFYTPMALPLARGLSPCGSVYDCMDELAAFDFAPKELLSRERDLFKTVDLVLTGGRSLYQAKRDRHADVHCFPSSVDHAHFGQPDVADHPDQAGLARPRLGYFGVIDERLDLALIAALADSHPAWQIVMVGPVAKLDPAKLPQRPNIHWMGQRLYNELPAFLAGWDVCLMPFALNASTRFISPTKTLEYLAAGRPVVSTAIRDVEQQYAGVVPIAYSPAEFVAACEAILQRTLDERSRFKAAAALTVAATSWEHTATAMLALLQRFDASHDEAVARTPSSARSATLSASAAA